MMKISCLSENTSSRPDIEAEHGLSLHIQTDTASILFDTGSTDMFSRNAERMNIDISSVDLAFISHGHYDHTGGLAKFMDINHTAPIYIRSSAFDGHWHTYSDKPARYIGISGQDPDDPRFIKTGSSSPINASLSIITNVAHKLLCPNTNSELVKINNSNQYVPDDFSHEQSLVIEENGKKHLICGCAHCGIINIVSEFETIYHELPSTVIGGFHTMRKDGILDIDKQLIRDIAAQMSKMNTKFYTCHCTGTDGFELFHDILGDQIEYLSAGMEIHI